MSSSVIVLFRVCFGRWPSPAPLDLGSPHGMLPPAPGKRTLAVRPREISVHPRFHSFILLRHTSFAPLDKALARREADHLRLRALPLMRLAGHVRHSLPWEPIITACVQFFFVFVDQNVPAAGPHGLFLDCGFSRAIFFLR